MSFFSVTCNHSHLRNQGNSSMNEKQINVIKCLSKIERILFPNRDTPIKYKILSYAKSTILLFVSIFDDKHLIVFFIHCNKCVIIKFDKLFLHNTHKIVGFAISFYFHRYVDAPTNISTRNIVCLVFFSFQVQVEHMDAFDYSFWLKGAFCVCECVCLLSMAINILLQRFNSSTRLREYLCTNIRMYANIILPAIAANWKFFLATHPIWLFDFDDDDSNNNKMNLHSQAFLFVPPF